MRIILHIDMDAFFASVEERENPKLKGRPIVIGADPKGGKGRGVVSTASYAARKFGIHSAMPISKAWQLCPAPQCAYLPGDMRLYEIVSERIMKLVRECVEQYAEAGPLSGRRSGLRILIEQVSVDEAYADVSYCGTFEAATQLAQTIKETIMARERLTCSVGIGPNKLIAKIASDFKKPDGLTVVRSEGVEDFLNPLPIRKLPGIGPKTEILLARRGIQTVADLRLALSADDELYKKACGLDDSPVVVAYAAKSIGHETTFPADTRDQALLTKTLLELCGEVMGEVRRAGAVFKTITVRVRFDNFETHTSSHTLRSHADDGTLLKQSALKLLFPYFRKKRLIRLIGVRVSNLGRR